MLLSSLVLIRKVMFKVKFCVMQTPTNFRQRLFLLSKDMEELLGYIHKQCLKPSWVIKTILSCHSHMKCHEICCFNN